MLVCALGYAPLMTGAWPDGDLAAAQKFQDPQGVAYPTNRADVSRMVMNALYSVPHHQGLPADHEPLMTKTLGLVPHYPGSIPFVPASNDTSAARNTVTNVPSISPNDELDIGGTAIAPFCRQGCGRRCQYRPRAAGQRGGQREQPGCIRRSHYSVSLHRERECGENLVPYRWRILLPERLPWGFPNHHPQRFGPRSQARRVGLRRLKSVAHCRWAPLDTMSIGSWGGGRTCLRARNGGGVENKPRPPMPIKTSLMLMARMVGGNTRVLFAAPT